MKSLSNLWRAGETKWRLKSLLDKIHTPTWLVILFAVVLILRIPSFFEPFSYGDEMIYLALGEGLRQGMVFYRDIHDNKPPFLYILAAVAKNVFWFRVILAFWNLATIFVFWKIAERLFPKKEKVQKVATVIFALLTTLPLLEGQVANAEVFMLLPSLAAFLILLTKKLNFRNLFGAGILFSMATLFKIPAAFDLPVILVFWLIFLKLEKDSLKGFIRKTLFLGLGFLAPILISFFFYFLKGALGEYISAAFLQNIGYLSSWRAAASPQPFFVKNGPLLVRGGVVLFGLVLLYLRKNKLSKTFIFIVIWLLFSLFAVTLSERPYPHYLIQSVPAISFLLTMLVMDKTIEQVLVIIPLSLTVFVPVYYNFWHYPTIPYYSRFIEFAVGRISKEEYFARFDGNVNRNYRIADVILRSTGKKDKIFVWGDSPTLYALTRRFPPIKYVATYHVQDFYSKKGVVDALESDNPKVIVLLPKSPEFKELAPFVRKNYFLIDEIDGAELYYLMSPKIRAFLAR